MDESLSLDRRHEAVLSALFASILLSRVSLQSNTATSTDG
jgi:hypothetical protein